MRDYDLLFGLLATQIRLVSKGALVEFAESQAEGGEDSLPDYLLSRDFISANERDLAIRLVDSVIHAHQGNIAAATEAFGGAEAAREAFSAAFQPGSGASDAATIKAGRLPHGLPPQIMPETLGRYTRGSEYARGGIGRILLVHDEQIGRDIILKELLPESGVSPTDPTIDRKPEDSPGTPIRHSAAMMARFLQEAKVTGQLEHPSIVPVYELGTRTDGQLYYTMKLVRGHTLAVTMKKCKRLEERLALLRSFLDVCQAMAYAHTKGVIHRDLKPSNIMVGEFGECVVLDWGLAKMEKDSDAHRAALEKTISQLRLEAGDLAGHKTSDREVLGTPLYMSPEQARGDVEDVTYRSDVYSMGVILYEILSGDLPHPWTNMKSTIQRVGSVPAPSIRKAVPQVPAELAAICDKALSFEADRRYPSAQELCQDVRRFLEGALVDAYAYSVKDTLVRLYRRHRAVINASAAAMACILAVGVFSYINIYQARNAEQAARILADTRRAEAEAQRALAEDQRNRAETAEQQTAEEKYVSEIRLADAYVRSFNYRAAESTLLATDTSFRNFEWSYLIAQCNRELAVLSGHERTVYGKFSPNGDQILTVSGDSSARIWHAEDHTVQHEWTFPEAPLADGNFSPDGKRVVFWTHDGRIQLSDTATGAVLGMWQAHNRRVNNCTFAPDGTRLLSVGADGKLRLWDVSAGGDPAEILNLDLPAPEQAYLTGDGERIVVMSPDGSPALYDADTGDPGTVGTIRGRFVETGGGLVVLATDTGLVALSDTDLTAQWSLPFPGKLRQVDGYPETGHLLVASSEGTIWLLNTSDGSYIASFNAGRPLISCVLSHDATRIVAITDQGAVQIHDRDSGEKLEEFGGHRHYVRSVDIAPGDEYILTGSLDGTVRKWPLKTFAGHTMLARVAGDYQPVTFSGDGTAAAVVDTTGTLTVVDLDSGNPIYQAQLTTAARTGRFSLSQNGARLALVLDGFLPAVISLPDGNTVSTFQGHQGPVNSIRFSPDESEVVTTSWDQTARIWNVETGELLGELAGHNGIVRDAVYAPDGTMVATVSNDQTGKLWDRNSLEDRFSMAHNDDLEAVAFSHDGRLIATGGAREVRVWQVDTGDALHQLDGPLSQLSALDFSLDGTRILCRSHTNELSIWDAQSGLLLTQISGKSGVNARWRYYHAPTGDIYAGSQDGHVLRYLPIVSEGESAIGDREALKALVASNQSAQQSAAPLPSATAPNTDVYLASSRAVDLLDFLGAHYGGIPESRLFAPLSLEREDVVATVADYAPDTLYDPDEPDVLERLRADNQPFEIDVLRSGAVRRFTVHRLPDVQTSRSVSLTAEQVTALLRQGLRHLRLDGTTIQEVNQRWNTERFGASAVPGIWVPNPIDGLAKAMLRTAGLEHNVRITAIGEMAPPDIEGLISLMESGIERVERNPEFDLSLTLERGLYETVRLQIQSRIAN